MRSAADRFKQHLAATHVYAVTDGSLDDDAMVDVTRSLLQAGIRLFQYRDKSRSDEARVSLAIRLGDQIKEYEGLLIVNDRVDIAIAADADGAHLGQDDLPLVEGRALLGPDRVLGASASYLEEIGPACSARIDYLGFGAAYATGTKPDAEFAGLDLLARACGISSVPVIGIGGISTERAPAVLATGADGVAVVSALYGAINPFEAALALLAASRMPR